MKERSRKSQYSFIYSTGHCREFFQFWPPKSTNRLCKWCTYYVPQIIRSLPNSQPYHNIRLVNHVFFMFGWFTNGSLMVHFRNSIKIDSGLAHRWRVEFRGLPTGGGSRRAEPALGAFGGDPGGLLLCSERLGMRMGLMGLV